MRLIHTSDQHLRPDRPLCRTDIDWIETQHTMLQFIVDKANELKADITIGGDLFDVPRVPPLIVSMFLKTIKYLNGNCYIIAGNHCLPWHKQENLMDSSMGIISSLNDKKIIYLPCDEANIDGRFEHSAQINDEIVLVHTLTFPTKDDIPYGSNATYSLQLLDKYPKCKFILTGDMHSSFVFRDKDRYVINPGCTTIQTADMLDYKPKAYFIDTGARIDVSTLQDKETVYRYGEPTIEAIELPNDRTLLTDSHLKEKKDRDSRIDSFIQTVKNNGKMTLSFEDNLRKAMETGGLSQDIISILEEIRSEE